MSSGKCKTALYVLCGQLWFLPWNSPMPFGWMPFLCSVFLILESWTLSLTNASEAHNALDVVLGSFETSWINHKFGRSATSGKAHRCSMFSPFVDKNSHCGLLESQSHRNGFVTRCQVGWFQWLFLICLLISFDWGMMCCFLRSFSLIHIVRFYLSVLLILQGNNFFTLGQVGFW